ncbi:DUF2167 domain-containing protein [Chitinophaga filiformis]|uniref:DUF2167 domain-containing protein n=1 Tax=Chitinophaga filiformis TaxID=104663 RepID=UPI001F424132|nr:DUF2167 domain-containing protein [Chitinophaga filiformis]MCF6405126.1 DUF2167 domain-containing protein [Chitinophaga filiformis]
MTVLLLGALTLNAAVPAKDSTEIYKEQLEHFIDSVRKAQKFETGLINLPGGKATVDVPKGFKFLNQQQSKWVLTELWGNPPSGAEDVLGMIFPENSDPFTDGSYVFVVEYEDMGYVKDDDAEKIDYDDMLKKMQEDEKETNKARVQGGYPTLHFVGWAQKPYYDKEKKVLHWAKEIKFGDQEGANTLNYDVRVLGRHGVLSLKAVCTMDELPLVKANIDKVLNMSSFTSGNAYSDFDPKIDKIAVWTIGGLVAGKVLAKAGLFAVLLKFLAAGWKFIAIGFLALIGFLKNLFSRKKKEKDIDTADLATTEEQDTVAVEEEAPAAEGLAADHTPAPEAGNSDKTSGNV